MARNIDEILERKGRTVHTIAPERSLGDAVALLDEHQIGALVVSGDGTHVDGVISERDVVRMVAAAGASALERTVDESMTRNVATCSATTSIDDVMATMTEQRFRHLPVVVDGELAGLISIGDAVKSRIDELEVRAQNLESYVTGSSY
jgi:CBS domain-containing protein